MVVSPANQLMLKVCLNSQDRVQVKLAHVFNSVSMMAGLTASCIGAAVLWEIVNELLLHALSGQSKQLESFKEA